MSPIGELVLQEGFGRRVVLEDGGDVVRKTFETGRGELGRGQATLEYERLRRFSEALRAVPGASCPRPIEMLALPPGLRMERAAGTCLFTLLGRRAPAVPAHERLADTMAAAIVAYVEALGEPYPDFKFDNVLYDASSGVLTFLDLGAPQDAGPPDPDASDYEVTMGDLLGSVVFQSARPRYLLGRRRHRATAALSVALLRALAARDAQLRPEPLLRAARAAYVRCAFGRSRSRSAWYATAGYVAGRRVHLPAGRFGPVSLRRSGP